MYALHGPGRCRQLAVLVSKPLLDWCIVAMSEPVFAALMVLFGLCLPRFLRRPSLSSLLLVSVVAALACLQRYAGVSLVMAGAVLIAFCLPGTRFRQRLKRVALFGVIAVTPTALWCLRNRMSAGRTIGGHRLHDASFELLSAACALAAIRSALERSPGGSAESPRGTVMWVVVALAVA